MHVKRCCTCKEEKPLTEFWKNKTQPDGLATECKVCMSAYHKEYRKENKAKIHAKKVEWRQRNLEHIQQREKEYRVQNRQRQNEKSRLWKKNNPEKASLIYRRRNLKVKYGLTLEQFDEMVSKQNNLCAICEQPEKIKGRPLSVDHCHDTGKIRGLLCNDCNRNLIAQRTDPEIFYKAARYLEKMT